MITNRPPTSLPEDRDSRPEQAAYWLARRDGGLSAAEQDNFFEWLRRDPKNADAFQELDDELRRIVAQLTDDLAELTSNWGDVKPMALAICMDQTEQWAIDLTRTVTDLDTVMAEKDPTRIRRTFNRFCTQASLTFNQMDVNLLHQCSELQRVDGPLAGVIKIIVTGP